MQPAATFVYDASSVDGLSALNPMGRLVKAATSNTRTVNSYDSMGRVRDQWQCTPANCGSAWFTAHYDYNLVGGLTSQSNPMGFTLTPSWNTANVMTGLSSSWSDAQHPATLYTLNTYNASLLPTQATLGNGLIEASAYNNRLQPTQLRVNNPSLGTDLLTMGYGFNYGTANNGNVASWSASGAQTFNRSYTYDALNRLATMSSPGETCAGLSWTYDIWGNRSDQTGGAGCYQTSHNAINVLNRIADTGYNYDTAGNMTSDPATSATYQYDAENRLISSASALGTGTYVYNADGKRARKTVGSTVTDYFYDLAGNIAAERVGSTWTKGYVYALALSGAEGGSLLAQYDNTVNPPTTFFVHKDHLGSTRLLTKVDKSIQENRDYLPYGESIAVSITSHLFTGKERDSESGLDNFGARYDSSSLGRFMSPDPDNASAFEYLDDPQSWNGYAYGRDNPILYIDSDGERYTVCVYDENGQHICNDVSDEDFDKAKADPGAGLSVKNGDIYANNVKVGTYVQTDVDLPPGIADMLHQAGVTASNNLNTGMKFMAENAAFAGLGAGLGLVKEALGTAIELGIAGKILKVAVNVAHAATTGHLTSDLAKSAAAVEGAIESGSYRVFTEGAQTLIRGEVVVDGATVGFKGKVVDGVARVDIFSVPKP